MAHRVVPLRRTIMAAIGGRPDMRRCLAPIAAGANDSGCVKTPQTRTRGKPSFSNRSKSTAHANPCDGIRDRRFCQMMGDVTVASPAVARPLRPGCCGL